jgi:radical SAM protein with 4Fe4S-binding SPASM domain
MPMEIFYRALSCVDAPAIKIMGGEPSLHPRFKKIVEACHEVVPSVRLFTNGLKKEILDSPDWHTFDTVTYNFYVANQALTNQNYLWDRDINRTFHVVVNTKTDFRRLYGKLRNLADLLQKQPDRVRDRTGIALSLDTQENIFQGEKREKLQEILFRVVRRIRLWGFRHISQDHPAPVCFWTNELIRKYMDEKLDHDLISGCLSPKCASWIGIDGTIRHCNQFPIYCGHLSDETTGSTLRLWYEKARKAKLALLEKDSQCRECPDLKRCLGGCFKAYHLDEEVSLHRLKCA